MKVEWFVAFAFVGAAFYEVRVISNDYPNRRINNQHPTTQKIDREAPIRRCLLASRQP
jgi:hypothetical protein